ncbi:MAG: hypothetical protein O3A47_11945 [Chloroflexi bacterium]|nr:hypothetical protein [Chloroflexota bacterium]
MDIVFDKGSSEKPRGHAFLFFRSSTDPDEIWASYLVMLPINVDVAKYVPPFLLGQVGDLGPKDLSAFAFPPVPESVGDYSVLEELADTRSDDLLFCGTIEASDVGATMMRVSEAVQTYADLYAKFAPMAEPDDEATGQDVAGLNVNEVMYDLMSENEKLGELTKLIGKLRYAVEGGEAGLAHEAELDIQTLGSQLSGSHQISRLVDAAKSGGDRGERLTDLFLKRSFHLVQEEYVKMGKVEAEIRALEADSSS